MKFMLLLLLSLSFSVNAKVETVEKVELDRYLGKWYEIASYPQWFQKDCTAVSAEYSLKKSGNIRVINSCRKFSPDGELKIAKGTARVKDKETGAKLSVQFFLPFIRIPFLEGKYWVIMLDEQDYQYSVVSDPKMETLWILSRTKVMDEYLYQTILDELKYKGYDLSKLKKMVH
ncbi:lipocalin family protein [Halobacteriovorax sp. HLS]|uniref:lipocalin family protein n=1 Tax=Halobacteriovorax sp. HLS TaxID=2234000 RepID=UPI000FD7682C|nr:lipocalin family protein [Halobacteriovorax sp. HLS]